MSETKLADLKADVDYLAALLADPQPGLSTWYEQLRSRLRSMGAQNDAPIVDTARLFLLAGLIAKHEATGRYAFPFEILAAAKDVLPEAFPD